MPVRPATMKPSMLRTARSRVAVEPRKLSTTERGYDGTWRKLRALFIAEHPLCVECEREGRIVPATQVDHIMALSTHPQLRLEWDNLQSLCTTHHGRKTVREQAQARGGGKV